MVTLSIILISDKKTQYSPTLQKKHHVQICRSGKKALSELQKNMHDFVIIDATTLGSTGVRICQQIKKQYPNVMLYHILPKDTKNKSQIESCADTVIVAPITARKLVNMMQRHQVAETDDALVCGGFTLHLNAKVLIANDVETSLSPKQFELIKLFFEHPNEIIARDRLMRDVWQTAYTGDTRTLDVHIRWIRNVLEPTSSRKPQYLKTVRGKGYILDIQESQK